MVNNEAAPESVDEALREVARDAVRRAQGDGAQDAVARIGRVREVGVQWRDGQIEQVTESTTRGLALSLYVDGRFASVSTSDLRAEATEGLGEVPDEGVAVVEEDDVQASY